MEKLFVSYEIALKVKELGFIEPCFGEYRQWDGCNPYLHIEGFNNSKGRFTVECSAPLYQQVIDWFREKHNILITVIPDKENNKTCFHYIIDRDSDYPHQLFREIGRTYGEISKLATYYEALDKAILEAIKLIS